MTGRDNPLNLSLNKLGYDDAVFKRKIIPLRANLLVQSEKVEV